MNACARKHHKQGWQNKDETVYQKRFFRDVRRIVVWLPVEEQNNAKTTDGKESEQTGEQSTTPDPPEEDLAHPLHHQDMG